MGREGGREREREGERDVIIQVAAVLSYKRNPSRKEIRVQGLCIHILELRRLKSLTIFEGAKQLKK